MLRRIGALVAVVLTAVAVAACGGSSGSGPVTLNWMVFPEPSGSFAKAAADCSAASHGAYKIDINFLSNASDQQRQTLVQRLAAAGESGSTRVGDQSPPEEEDGIRGLVVLDVRDAGSGGVGHPVGILPVVGALGRPSGPHAVVGVEDHGGAAVLIGPEQRARGERVGAFT